MPRAARPFLLVALLVATPLPAATGSLSIESQPDVEVVWDGTALGRTDANGTMQIEGIPVGEYVLELSKTGYRSERKRVVITEEPATHHGYLENLAQADPAPAPPSPPRDPEPEKAPQSEPRAGVAEPPATEAADPPQPMPAEESAQALVADDAAPEPSETPAPSESEPSEQTAATSVAEALEAEDAPQGDGTALQLLLALAIAIAGGLAIFLTGRRSSSVAPTRAAALEAEPRVEKPRADRGDDSHFIESLKARERALDGSSHEVAEIIDVEFVDIQELEGDV